MNMLVLLIIAAAQPPAQPTSGPAGSDYRYTVKATTLVSTAGLNGVVVYEPVGMINPPVVVYLHGWSAQAFGPELYGQLLSHVTRKGFAVVYVELGSLVNTAAYRQNAANGISRALAWLKRSDPIAYCGHSIGGVTALRLASDHQRYNLPAPRCVVTHEAAGQGFRGCDIAGLSLNGVPLTMVLAENGKSDARQAVAQIQSQGYTPFVVTITADSHGSPKIAADHQSFLTTAARSDASWASPTNDFDYAAWRTTVAALTNDTAYLDPRNPLAVGKGSWSDGVPVKVDVIGVVK